MGTEEQWAQRNKRHQGTVEQWAQRNSRHRGTVRTVGTEGTEEQWAQRNSKNSRNSGHRGTVGTEEQWAQRNSLDLLLPVTTRNINLSLMSLFCSRTKGGKDWSSVGLSAATYLTCQLPSICVKTD